MFAKGAGFLNNFGIGELLKLVAGASGLIFFILFLYICVSYIKRRMRETLFLIKNERKGHYIETKDGNTDNNVRKPPYQEISNDIIKKSTYGSEYTYSFWIKMEDWDYNYNKPKHIFHKGDRKATSVNPGVWFYPKDNNLMIRIDTHNRITNKNSTVSGRYCQYWSTQYPHKHPYSNDTHPGKDIGDHNYCRNPDNSPGGTWCYTNDKSVVKERCGIQDHKVPESMDPEINKTYDAKNQCDIINIPVQRWVYIVITLHNRTLDVYVNGKLSRSCTYSEVPKFNSESLHITDNGGFKGGISEFRYFDKALSPSEIYSLYRKGYASFSIWHMLKNLFGKFDFSLKTSVNANIN